MHKKSHMVNDGKKTREMKTDSYNPRGHSSEDMQKNKQKSVEYDKRAAQFQHGSNPDMPGSFERSLIMREKMERNRARVNYIQGIQGRDGGHLIDEPDFAS